LIMRHAIYYAPASGRLLHKLGSSWLGRDAASGETVTQPPVEGLKDVTQEPARYGFHATLKAPFVLNQDMRRVDLGDAVALVAAQMDVVTIPKIALREIDGFLALAPETAESELSVLAELCVCALDSFRSPASEAEINRRRNARLSPRQDQLLLRWGYPYVLDEFRFHMTLTRKLQPEERRHFLHAATEHFAPVIGAPLEIDALTIFADSPFLQKFSVEERFLLRRTDRLKVAS
jgi:putative phosphonate metabolism protein